MGVEIAGRFLTARGNAGTSPEFFQNGSASTVRTTISRHDIGSVTLASGIGSGGMYSVGIPLYAGDVVTYVGFRSGTTALGTPTAWFFALYSSASTPALLGQTADQASAAWGANTAMEIALTSPVTIPTDGFYYVSYSCTGGTMPTLTGVGLAQNALTTGFVTGQKALSVISGTGLGGTAPATITSTSATTAVAYAWVR